MSDIRVSENDLPSIPKRDPAYIHQDGFLVNTGKANDAIYVNATALMVWGLCNGESTVGEITAELERAYPEHPEQVREDVLSAIDRLVAHRVVILAPST